ncbi:MAG: NUDIX domain-containing protein [Capsulimonas sp.]|uniref:NUDIX domain-containing protein n=1 Tax=Capsulimonas sp. TaxID=2494211 RepID=UPI0032635C2E
MSFPTVYWPAWDSDATFFPGVELPPASEGRLWAVLTFVFYGAKIVLADITDRGYCIPSGKIEAGETIVEAAEREIFEETGVRLRENRLRLIGCYLLTPRSGAKAGEARYCPVFVAEAVGFEPIPEGSESRGVFLAQIEDIADLYFFWDDLMAAVFEYAGEQHEYLMPSGVAMASLTAE